MRTIRLAAILFVLLPTLASAAEPRIFIMGVWPNRLRLFDETSEEFVGELGLHHGAVTTYTVTAHTPDYERLFFVTDRMESVEVVDPSRREVVDELKISTPGRRVRIFAVAPNATGNLLYLHARGTRLENDRFVREPFELLLYDLDAHEVKETVRLPDEVKLDFLDTLTVSRDGGSLFIIGKDVYELSTETHEILDVITWSRPSSPGYGSVQVTGTVFTESEPGILYGTYQTTDPALHKSMSGLVRLDLNTKRFESFELGPALNVTSFSLSPDGAYGFAGIGDMAVIDMKSRRIIVRKKNFERGRTNNTIIVSADGTEIYVTGVGDSMQVYDARTLALRRVINIGADIMSAPLPLPRSAITASSANR